MATHKALAVTEIGKPLAIISLPTPEPQENELLIKLTVCGLNPLDQKIRDNDVFQMAAKIPLILGGDLVGIVVRNGSKTDKLPIGSHVFSQARTLEDAGLQEYALIDARYSSIVPDGISDEDAAVFPINLVSSAVSLFELTAGLGFPFPGTDNSFDYKSQKLVIIGGGTNCGKLAIQLAHIAGIGTIITTASLSGEEELKGYGATHVIDRKASNIEDQVRNIVGDDLLHVYDTFHMDDHSLAVSLLSNSKKGIYAHLLPGKPRAEVAAKKQAGFEGKMVFGKSEACPDFAGAFWKQFPKWLQAGDIKPLSYNIIEGLDADRVNAALDIYQDLSKGKRYHVRF